MNLRRCLLLLLLAALCLGAAAQAQDAPALYMARPQEATAIYEKPDRNLLPLRQVRKNAQVEVLDVMPDWLLVRYDGIQGYMRRRNLDLNNVTPVDAAAMPRYPAVPSTYLGWVKQAAPVRDAPNAGAAALITLHEGARVALMGMENGWAKLIYHRQYAYIDTRQLGEVQMLFRDEKTADASAPIAAYTSFYKITEDENNIGRMKNLAVACEKFEPIKLLPGDTLDFNKNIGPYRRANGYFPAIVLVDGGTALGYGGGTCQVSSTLYNTILPLPGIEIVRRRPHGPSGASYLPLGADAAVGNEMLNLILRNNYPFPIRLDGTVQDGAITIAVYKAE